MKRMLAMTLVIILVVCCLGCQNTNNDDGDNPANKEQKVYNLDVSFTAKVDELVDDPNTEDDIPRYAVVRPFQAPPILLDVGEGLGKTLEEDMSYTFIMGQKQNITMSSDKAYDLDTLIPLYDLEVQSVDTPSEEQIGLNAVKIEYMEIRE